MKSLPYLLAAAAGLGIYLYVAKSAIKNPWRGTGTACERDFDAKPEAEQVAILEKLKTMDDTSRAALLRCEKV